MIPQYKFPTKQYQALKLKIGGFNTYDKIKHLWGLLSEDLVEKINTNIESLLHHLHELDDDVEVANNIALEMQVDNLIDMKFIKSQLELLKAASDKDGDNCVTDILDDLQEILLIIPESKIINISDCRFSLTEVRENFEKIMNLLDVLVSTATEENTMKAVGDILISVNFLKNIYNYDAFQSIYTTFRFM